MSPKKRLPTTITTREELERVMGELALVSNARSCIIVEMESRLTEIRADYEKRLGDFAEQIDALQSDLEAWAVLHPAEFVAKKSIDLTHGVIGFRTSPPALKTLKGVKWDHVLDVLKCKRLAEYIRTIDEVNKEALLADRDKIGPDRLSTYGLRVDQPEKFYAEPKSETQP